MTGVVTGLVDTTGVVCRRYGLVNSLGSWRLMVEGCSHAVVEPGEDACHSLRRSHYYIYNYTLIAIKISDDHVSFECNYEFFCQLYSACMGYEIRCESQHTCMQALKDIGA